MGWIDILLGIPLIWGLYKGFKNGLLLELASLVALIAGIYGAIHFSYIAGDYLSERLQWEAQYLKIISFLITFIVIVLLVHLLGKLLTKVADVAMLGLLNKIAGGIFGLLKMAIIIGALLIFFYNVIPSKEGAEATYSKESVLYTPLRDIGAFVFSKIFPTEKEEATLSE